MFSLLICFDLAVRIAF